MPNLSGKPGCSGCAAVARLLGGDPAGSATHMTSWLLIEQPGAWPADAVETTLAGVLDKARLHALGENGLRPLLIRRPGKHARGSEGPLTVFVGSGRPGAHWLERIELSDLAEIEDLDLEAVAASCPGHGEPVEGPMFLVCTHGAKDMCCAVFGRPVVKALAEDYADRTWEVSHVGGDRWAGNMLVVPDGYLHGQLGPDEAKLVAKAALARQVRPDHLRGRTSAVSGWAQCAEISVRQHTGLLAVDAVTATAVIRSDDTPASRVVTVTAGGRLFEVVVRHRPPVEADGNRCTGHLTIAGYEAVELRPAPAAN